MRNTWKIMWLWSNSCMKDYEQIITTLLAKIAEDVFSFWMIRQFHLPIMMLSVIYQWWNANKKYLVVFGPFMVLNNLPVLGDLSVQSKNKDWALSVPSSLFFLVLSLSYQESETIKQSNRARNSTCIRNHTFTFWPINTIMF